MSNQAKSGRGLSVIYGTSIFGEVLDGTTPDSNLGKIDTTTHNNTNGVKTSYPGWIENGEMSVEMNYVGRTEQDALYTMYNARTIGTWMVVGPMALGRAWSFTGYLSSLPIPKFNKDGNVTLSFKVQASGVLTPLTTAAAGLTTPFLSITDQGATALTLSPAAANATYGYQVTTDLADTGVKITPTASAGSIYVDNTLVVSGAASSAITIGTSAGDVIMVPVVVFENGKVPKIYWIEVTHGYV